jgi:hypothetical protein
MTAAAAKTRKDRGGNGHLDRPKPPPADLGHLAGPSFHSVAARARYLAALLDEAA